MASLNLTSPSRTGAQETLVAAGASGDSFPLPGDGIVLRVANAGGADRTLTIVGQQPCNFGEVHDAEVTLPDGETTVIEIPGSAQFRDNNGRVQLTYDDNTGLTLAAFAK